MSGSLRAIPIFAVAKIILPWSTGTVPVHEIDLALMLAA